MKVQARWKIKGLNPFKLQFAPDDMYFKTVEVPDNTSMEQVERWAREDPVKEGYVFVGVEKVSDDAKLSPKKEGE